MARVTGHVETRGRKRGGPAFYLKYRLADGRQRMTLLGPVWTDRSRPPAGFYTRKTAEEALQATLADARRGLLPDSRRSGRTFGEACDEWLRYIEHDRQRRPSTMADYRSTVERALITEFGRDTPLHKLTTERIETWRGKLLDDGTLSRRTIQKWLVILGGILKRAKRKAWITTNPTDDVERVAVKRSGDFNVLTPVEVAACARAAEDAQDAAIVTVAAFTGLRLGELRALRWRDVDFDKRTVHVRRSFTHGHGGPPKSGNVRSVPLIDQAALVLDGLSERAHFTDPDDLVFCTETGDRRDESGIRAAFYAALEAAELGAKREGDDPIVFHDLRHTFGTLAVEAWPLHDVQAYMGHANVQTTMIYVHHVPKTAAADVLTRIVTAASTVEAETVSPSVSRNAEFAIN